MSFRDELRKKVTKHENAKRAKAMSDKQREEKKELEIADKWIQNNLNDELEEKLSKLASDGYSRFELIEFSTDGDGWKFKVKVEESAKAWAEPRGLKVKSVWYEAGSESNAHTTLYLEW